MPDASSSVIWFLGVSTGPSLIHRAAPRWGELLGRPLSCRGVDLPLGAQPAQYRAFCESLATADEALGAVVTSHKTALFDHCAGQFTHLDPDARLSREINAIASSSAGLAGWARDPVSTGRVLDRIWPDPGGDIIILGGGGTAAALLTHLVRRSAGVHRAVVCEPEPRRRAALGALLRDLQPRFEVQVPRGRPERPWDGVVARAAAGALVVNATGLGKDRPGSPLTAEAEFPPGAIAWDLNYRGSLEFLHQAARHGARVHDGWDLFCHGWAAALTPILRLPDDPSLGDRFAAAIEDLRPAR